MLMSLPMPTRWNNHLMQEVYELSTPVQYEIMAMKFEVLGRLGWPSLHPAQDI